MSVLSRSPGGGLLVRAGITAESIVSSSGPMDGTAQVCPFAHQSMCKGREDGVGLC